MNKADIKKSIDGFHIIEWGGCGPKVHLLHGIGLAAGVYFPLVKQLTPFLNVTGIDLRGHGNTSASADPKKLISWDIFFSDYRSFLNL